MPKRAALILASSSPRRRRLLETLGRRFEVDVEPVDETLRDGELPEDAVLRLAETKARAVHSRHPFAPVLGADTVVVCGRRILEKPASLDEARRMLRLLSGRAHRVLTGVCLLLPPPADAQCWVAETAVRFHRLPETTIDRYLASVHVLDKAGAYAIQEHGDLLIERIDGSYSNVVGLPVEDVVERLEKGSPDTEDNPHPGPLWRRAVCNHETTR